MSLTDPGELPGSFLSLTQNDQEAGICRVCDVPSLNCLPLFKPYLIAGEMTTLAQVLIYCTALEIHEEEDFLPPHICPDCMLQMQASLQFKRGVHQMDKLLRERHLEFSEMSKDAWPEDGQYIIVLDERESEDRETETEAKQEQGQPIEVAQKQEGQTEGDCRQITEKEREEARLFEEDLFKMDEEPMEQSDLLKPSKTGSISPRKTPNPSLKCQICGKQLSTSNSFKYHMRLHGTATPYICHICGESFKTRNAHDGHVTLHNPNNPNRCSTCGKVYRQASSLRTHQLTHSGIKPFECNICGKRLTQRSGYKKHMLTHTGEKPHGCDICGRSFRYSSNLISHKRCHSQEKPHQCQVCHKRSFGSASELNRHMIVHSSERPFACECGKSFKRQVYLRLHQQSHKEGRNKWGKAEQEEEEDQAES